MILNVWRRKILLILFDKYCHLSWGLAAVSEHTKASNVKAEPRSDICHYSSEIKTKQKRELHEKRKKVMLTHLEYYKKGEKWNPEVKPPDLFKIKPKIYKWIHIKELSWVPMCLFFCHNQHNIGDTFLKVTVLGAESLFVVFSALHFHVLWQTAQYYVSCLVHCIWVRQLRDSCGGFEQYKKHKHKIFRF